MNGTRSVSGRAGKRGGGGFTLVELLVVIAIITLLAGILAPTVFRARIRVMQTICTNNLHQIADGCIAYAQDGTMHRLVIESQLPTVAPSPTNWDHRVNGNAGCLWLLMKYKHAASGSVYICPEAAHHDTSLREPQLTTETGQVVDGFYANTCSYSYISMVRANIWSSSTAGNPADETTLAVNPQLIIIADKNPRIARIGGGRVVAPNNLRNSANHREEGQNIARLDRVAKWIRSPQGDGDDVYSSSEPGFESTGRRGTVSDTFVLP